MKKILIILISLFALSCSGTKYENPHVEIQTNLGTIELELYPAKAPKTVAAFLANVQSGLYDNSSFYRVLKTEQLPSDFNTGVIQGGIYNGKTAVNNLRKIEHESTNQTGLSNTDGFVSMARKDTGTATSEFFICIGDQSPLDYGRRGTADGQGFAVFGKVFSGMNIVKKIQNQQSHGDRFDEKINIKKIILL